MYSIYGKWEWYGRVYIWKILQIQSFIDNQIALTSSINQHKISYNKNYLSLQDFPGVNPSMSFSFAIYMYICILYISLFNLQIPLLVYINVHEYYLNWALFFVLVLSLQHLHLNIIIVCQNPTVQRPIQAEIQVHRVCPNVGNFVLIYTASKGDLIINKNYLSLQDFPGVNPCMSFSFAIWN
jgi:hypothetical protein